MHHIRHPSRRFVAALIADSRTDDYINTLLGMYGLIQCSPKELNDLRAWVGTVPSNSIGRRAWYRKNKLHSFYVTSDEYRQALAFCSEHRTKIQHALHLFSMGEVSPKEAASYVQKLFRLSVEARAIQTYWHYFWDREALSTPEWFPFLDEKNHPAKYTYSNALRSSVEEILWELGYRESFDETKVALAARHEAAMHYFSIMRRPSSKATAEAGLAYTKTYEAWHALSSEKHGKLSEVLKRLSEIQSRYDEEPVQTMPEILKGKHTSAEKERNKK